jgi:hypothetical protein
VTRLRVPTLVLLIVAVVSAASGSATPTPTRTIATALPVRDLALTGRSVAYVADAGLDQLRCAHISLWNTATNRRSVFDSKEQCVDLTSTGQGVWDIAVATNRLLWITYGGGNIREWTLWTATATRRTPRRLRFVARDVDAAPPIVLGPGTSYAVPYAVDREIVYLANDGAALFRTTVTAPVRALASHPLTRPRGPAAVVALLASNELIGLHETGTEVFRVAVPAGVSAIAYDDRRSILYQLGNVVHTDSGDVALPAGAVMVDASRGLILWTRAGDLGVTSMATRASKLLVDGSRTRPVVGQIELGGLAWASGHQVRWRVGRVP